MTKHVLMSTLFSLWCICLTCPVNHLFSPWILRSFWTYSLVVTGQFVTWFQHLVCHWVHGKQLDYQEAASSMRLWVIGQQNSCGTSPSRGVSIRRNFSKCFTWRFGFKGKVCKSCNDAARNQYITYVKSIHYTRQFQPLPGSNDTKVFLRNSSTST